MQPNRIVFFLYLFMMRMMKSKVFYSALVLSSVGIVGCDNDDHDVVPQGELIKAQIEKEASLVTPTEAVEVPVIEAVELIPEAVEIIEPDILVEPVSIEVPEAVEVIEATEEASVVIEVVPVVEEVVIPEPVVIITPEPVTTVSGVFSYDTLYATPKGQTEMTVVFEVQDNVVKSAKLTGNQKHQTSIEYQTLYQEAVGSYVVGKTVESLAVLPSKVNGSSLTSAGFNEALLRLQKDA